MSRLLHISQGWDLAQFGPAEFEWDDADGTWNVYLTSGRYMHPDLGASLTHPSTTPFRTVSVANPYTQFAVALQAAMNASGTTRTYTVTWSSTTGRYTIAVNTGTFSMLYLPATPVRELGFALLGWAPATVVLVASYTGTLCPRFAIEPRIPFIQKWTDFVAMGDSIPKLRTESSAVVTLRPNVIPYRTMWEHGYEPTDQVQRWNQAVPDSPLWCWSDMWNEGIASGEWLFYRERAVSPHPTLDRKFAFQVVNVDFDEQTVSRSRRDMSAYWSIRLDASLRGYST